MQCDGPLKSELPASWMQTNLQLRLGILLENTSDLLGPSNNGPFEERGAVFRTGASTKVNRGHWQSSFALDLTTYNRST